MKRLLLAVLMLRVYWTIPGTKAVESGIVFGSENSNMLPALMVRADDGEGSLRLILFKWVLKSEWAEVQEGWEKVKEAKGGEGMPLPPGHGHTLQVPSKERAGRAHPEENHSPNRRE